VFQRKIENRQNGQGGQIAVQTATSELPEWLQSALYRGAAKGGLTETDPLWGCLVANGELLRAYLDAQATGTKKSVEELTKEVRDLARSVQYVKSPESRPDNIAKRWGIIFIIAGCIFLAGYFFCWSRLHVALEESMIRDRQIADERVARVIKERPADARPYLDFVSYGGLFAREPIAPGPGHPETEGFVMRPGHLAKPWVSSDGEAAVIPIPSTR
jgi:hypothetical protein